MYSEAMRTTVDLDADTAKEITRLRNEEGRGLSEAVNELIRRGMLSRGPTKSFKPVSADLGLRIDVSNIAQTLELLEGPDAR